MSRRHNLRLIKHHWTYTALELAETLNVNISSIRIWTRLGLRPIKGTWPYLFAPADIVAFLEGRKKPRQPLEPGWIYCVACRAPREPAGATGLLRHRSETSADLIGECPDCGRRIFRRVRLAELAEKCGNLKVHRGDVTAPIGSDRDVPRTAQVKGAAS